MRNDRNRQIEALDDIDLAAGTDMDGMAGNLLVTFTQTAYPTVAQSVYACHPVDINVADTEGAVPTFVPDTTAVIYAANIGTTVPASGSYVIGTSTGGRVTFRWDG